MKDYALTLNDYVIDMTKISKFFTMNNHDWVEFKINGEVITDRVLKYDTNANHLIKERGKNPFVRIERKMKGIDNA